MRTIVLCLLLALPVALPAQDAASPRTVEVRLSSFGYNPEIIRLRAGAPVVLHLVNNGARDHNFSAPLFFAAATRVSGGPVDRGRIEVPGRESRDVRLTPARGTYNLRCTHTLHTELGMEGQIVVE